MRYIINAKIKTLAPLSIKMPKPEGGRENEFENFPVMTRGLDEQGNKQQTGYLPATTLRGFLRRAVTLRSMKQAAESGKPYKLPQVYAEMIGQDADSEKQAGEIDLLAVKKAREENQILDLFGSGLGIKSRLRVNHFVPNVNVLPEAFTGVRKDLDDTEEALELMDKNDVNTFLNRSDSNAKRAAASALVKSLEGEIKKLERKGGTVPADKAEALKIAKENEAKFKSDMGDMQNSTKTIVQHFAFPSGIELSGRLVVENALERDLALIQHGLDELSKKPVLGAQSARGCGEIEGYFDIMDGDGKLIKSIVIGDYKSARVTEFS